MSIPAILRSYNSHRLFYGRLRIDEGVNPYFSSDEQNLYVQPFKIAVPSDIMIVMIRALAYDDTDL